MLLNIPNSQKIYGKSMNHSLLGFPKCDMMWKKFSLKEAKENGT